MLLSKKIFALSVATIIYSSSIYAADGNINFTGEMIGNACTITGSSGSDVSVAMGNVALSSFNNAGDTAAPTQFTIGLSSCSSVTSAQISFDGTQDTTNTNLIKLATGDNAATGVGVGIYESDSSTIIPLYSKSKAVAIANGTAQFNFIAKYVSTSKTVTAGPANASATFTVMYK